MLLRGRRTGSPVDVERVWTEIRALATDYGQSLDPSRTLRHDELVLAGGPAVAGAAPGDAGPTAGGPGDGRAWARPRTRRCDCRTRQRDRAPRRQTRPCGRTRRPASTGALGP
ncbi:hypothetical protein IOD13_08735 [Brevibacterium casei]|nr:hypothetical protein [Brevibacterium casei]